MYNITKKERHEMTGIEAVTEDIARLRPVYLKIIKVSEHKQKEVDKNYNRLRNKRDKLLRKID